MSERATRPLNQQAVKAADDDLYSSHAGDPRPNALYDENGNRKPLDATDPDQADLRNEWMESYKANGGGTEPVDLSGSDPGEPVQSCDHTQQQVDPVIVAGETEIDESEVTPPEEPADQRTEEEAEAEEGPADGDDTGNGTGAVA